MNANGFEGEIYRFRPGISRNFVPRWFQVSSNAIRYFKNFLMARTANKPLLAIPESAILGVTRVTDIDK